MAAAPGPPAGGRATSPGLVRPRSLRRLRIYTAAACTRRRARAGFRRAPRLRVSPSSVSMVAVGGFDGSAAMARTRSACRFTAGLLNELGVWPQ